MKVFKPDYLASRFYNLRYRIKYSRYLNINKQNSVIFVHPPKTAGTSIACALDMQGPGHFTLNEHLESKSVEVRGCVVSVRQPMERLKSLFKYSRKASQKSALSPLRGLRKFETLNEFVLSDTFPILVRYHYFFKPQYHYSRGVFDLEFSVNFVRTEFLQDDLSRIDVTTAGMVNTSPSMNEQVLDISDEALSVVEKNYFVDYLYYECVERYITNLGVEPGKIAKLNQILEEGT